MTFTYFAVKSGSFYLLQYPEVHGSPTPMSAALYGTADAALEALGDMRAARQQIDPKILMDARVVMLTVTEVDGPQ